MIVYIGATYSAVLFSRYKSDFCLNRQKQKYRGYSTTTIQYAIEAVVYRCSVEKVFLEISQNSQENAARASFLIKCNFIKKRLWYKCFPVNFAKFLRTPFLTEHLWWLLLMLVNEGVLND